MCTEIVAIFFSINSCVVKGILNGAKRREDTSYLGQVSASLLNHCITGHALTPYSAFHKSPEGGNSAQKYSVSSCQHQHLNQIDPKSMGYLQNEVKG